jgi:hypothetical protein
VTLEARLSKNRGGADSVNQSVKCAFVFIIPIEAAPFSTMSDECVERGGEHAKVVDIHAIKVEETEERA